MSQYAENAGVMGITPGSDKFTKEPPEALNIYQPFPVAEIAGQWDRTPGKDQICFLSSPLIVNSHCRPLLETGQVSMTGLSSDTK